MKIKRIHIYCIYFPTNNKYYIGQTIHLEKRMSEHLKSGSLVCKALRKYDDWKISILHTCKSRDEANRIEIEEIRNFNSVHPNGYNLTAGGDGGDTFTNNPNKEETRKKMQEKKNAKGYKFTEEQLERLRDAHRGLHPTDETKEKMRVARQGLYLTKEAREKISEAMKGNKHATGKHWKRPDVSKRNKINSGNRSFIQGENNPMNRTDVKIKRLQTKIANLEKDING